MTHWILWGALLMCQNAAFTWVSRARNSASYGYHAVAAMASNGVYILSMYFVVDALRAAKDSGSVARMAGVAVFYTACTVAGSVAMHYASRRWLETGRRKVGA